MCQLIWRNLLCLLLLCCWSLRKSALWMQGWLLPLGLLPPIIFSKDETLSKHATWLEDLKQTYTFTRENALDILLQETGKVFAAVLEDAGVYKNTPQGKAAFRRFATHVNEA